jgi:hypothetical protein
MIFSSVFVSLLPQVRNQKLTPLLLARNVSAEFTMMSGLDARVQSGLPESGVVPDPYLTLPRPAAWPRGFARCTAVYRQGRHDGRATERRASYRLLM